jgi:hypothetical protein
MTARSDTDPIPNLQRASRPVVVGELRKDRNVEPTEPVAEGHKMTIPR